MTRDTLAQHTFGDWLRQQRRQHDLTQAELAQQVGCSAITLRKLEAEQRRPSKQTAERLAQVLNVPAAERPAFLRFARGDHFAATAEAEGPVRLEINPSPRHNLPLQLTRFIGRATEIAEVKHLIAIGRLLTLTGPGGTGKTRLALQVAGELLPDFPGEVCLTEFAPLADPLLVPQAVAAALGVHEQFGRTLTEILAGYLESRPALLIFDNCEHLVAACAQLAAALLRACPDLRILVTSRETLNLPGETVWIVPSLSLPDPQPWRDPASTRASLPAYERSEAVRLFVDRATAASPTFRLTLDNGPWLAEICRRLDGMPLAIELAAARVRALSVAQIAERLEDRFHLLTSGSRGAPPRQQSLEATLDWSYTLLSPSEQVVLQRLSVFAGGWTLEAAEAVCPDAGLAASDVLNLLSQLVDKSLVQADPAAGAIRYRLLETIRQYAARRLAETGESAAWRDRHLDYFVDWAESLQQRRNELDPFDWLSRFEAEHDNLRAALAWSLESESRAERGLRLADLVADFWFLRGYYSEGRMRLTAALAQASTRPGENAAARLGALRRAGDLAAVQSDYPAARAVWQASLVLCEQMGPAGQMEMAPALRGLGDVEMEEGNYAAALTQYQAALALFQVSQVTNSAIHTLTMMGWALMRAGDYQPAAEIFEEALRQSRALGHAGLLAQALAGLGELTIRQGEYPRATTLLEESLALRRGIGEQWGIAVTLGSLGWLALRQHNFQRVRERLGESLGIRVETGDVGGSAWCLEKLAAADLLQGQAARAGRRPGYFQRAAQIFGAAAALRARRNAVMDSADQPEYEQHLADLRAGLGEAEFATAWAAGGALTLEQAAAFALAEPERPVQGSSRPTGDGASQNWGELTARERQVAALIAQGQSNRKIAAAMVVGVRTVETYVTRILGKLHLDSRVQIATWAIETGLLKGAPL